MALDGQPQRVDRELAQRDHRHARIRLYSTRARVQVSNPARSNPVAAPCVHGKGSRWNLRLHVLSYVGVAVELVRFPQARHRLCAQRGVLQPRGRHHVSSVVRVQAETPPREQDGLLGLPPLVSHLRSRGLQQAPDTCFLASCPCFGRRLARRRLLVVRGVEEAVQPACLGGARRWHGRVSRLEVGKTFRLASDSLGAGGR